MIPAFIKDRLNHWWTLPEQLARIEAKVDALNTKSDNLKETVMANTQDVLNKIAELKTKVSGIGDQFVAKLSDLQAKIDADQDTSAEMAALNDLGASLQTVDDLVPNLPKTQPAEPDPGSPVPTTE